MTGIKKREMWGRPDMAQVSTSHVERKNLSIRMGVRRMTRLTNAFSKKWENHEYHLSLWFLYYNFSRPHQTLSKAAGHPTSPAMAAGIADDVWGLEELLTRLAAEA
jgi:hypothetical protein